MYPLPRAQSLQRRTTCDLNFGVREARIIKAFLATVILLFMRPYHLEMVTCLLINPARERKNSQEFFRSLTLTLSHLKEKLTSRLARYNTRMHPKSKDFLIKIAKVKAPVWVLFPNEQSLGFRTCT